MGESAKHGRGVGERSFPGWVNVNVGKLLTAIYDKLCDRLPDILVGALGGAIGYYCKTLLRKRKASKKKEEKKNGNGNLS